jgi:hypothetical protein
VVLAKAAVSLIAHRNSMIEGSGVLKARFPGTRRRVAAPAQRFAFAFAAPYRVLLALLGVRPATASVTVDDAELNVRFGPWLLRTDRDNVVAARTTGPYRWWRAIGPHLSLVDRGATFGTTTAGGVCIEFAEPVPALAPRGRLRHPSVTVTVEDGPELIGRLRRR